MGTPVEELEKRLKKLKGIVAYRKNNNINQPDTPQFPETKSVTKDYT